jgi:hypothetical protein
MMAVELEQTVMRDIGLGNHYSWFNGSGSCEYIRRDAVNYLSDAAKKHDLIISPKWLAHCKKAIQVDGFGSGRYGLTNVWVACSYTIQDAIYRLEAGEAAGFDPPSDDDHWYFFHPEKREAWKRRNHLSPICHKLRVPKEALNK